MNREYFTKPIQGGRSAHDYGHTRITPVEKPLGWFGLTVFFAIAAIVIVVMTVGSAVVR
jgi:hypothetical protein